MTHTQKAALGVLAFLSCSAAFATLARIKTTNSGGRTALASATTATATATAKFDNGLVELRQPPRGAQRVPQQLVNDEILSSAVREIRRTLYVYVRAAADEPKSNVCEYISTVYSRLWDEMLQAEALSLNCVVVGDVDGAGYISRSQLHGLPELEKMTTYDTLEIDTVKRNRASGGLSELVFSDYSGSKLADSQQQVHYFDADDTAIPRFKRVCMGGTFDNLHNGHKKLLALAAASCEGSLVVGITGDEMLKKKSNAGFIGSYKERSASVASFLGAVKPALKLEAVELVDPFGPAVTDKAIEAIVVSSETIPGAMKINEVRKEKGLPGLAILVTRRGEGATLSSTFLRRQAGRKRRAVESAFSRAKDALDSLFARF